MQAAEPFVGPVEVRDFEERMRRDGFVEIMVKSNGPMPVNTPHQHPFDVRGVVLDGEATITCAGVPGTYRKGDTFEMQAGVSHTEAYGPHGYVWLVGRRYPEADGSR